MAKKRTFVCAVFTHFWEGRCDGVFEIGIQLLVFLNSLKQEDEFLNPGYFSVPLQQARLKKITHKLSENVTIFLPFLR